MTSHKILCVAGALASAVGTAGAQSATKGAPKATPGARPLNIVYIMSDDHSYQMISAYDQRYISTPNIDALAREGVASPRASSPTLSLALAVPVCSQGSIAT